MYANFYHDDICMYSVEVQTEREAEHRADHEYVICPSINDWTLTEKPISKNVYH